MRSKEDGTLTADDIANGVNYVSGPADPEDLEECVKSEKFEIVSFPKSDGLFKHKIGIRNEQDDYTFHLKNSSVDQSVLNKIEPGHTLVICHSGMNRKTMKMAYVAVDDGRGMNVLFSNGKH